MSAPVADDGAPSREGLALAELKELRAETRRLVAYADWLNNVRACEHPYGSIRGQKAKDIRAVLGRQIALEGVAEALRGLVAFSCADEIDEDGSPYQSERLHQALAEARAALLKVEESR